MGRQLFSNYSACRGFSSFLWFVTPEQCPHRTSAAGKVSRFPANHRDCRHLGFHPFTFSSPLAPHSQLTANAELKVFRDSRMEGVGSVPSCSPQASHATLGYWE